MGKGRRSYTAYSTVPVPWLRDARLAGWVTYYSICASTMPRAQNSAGIGSSLLWRRLALAILLLFIYGAHQVVITVNIARQWMLLKRQSDKILLFYRSTSLLWMKKEWFTQSSFLIPRCPALGCLNILFKDIEQNSKPMQIWFSLFVRWVRFMTKMKLKLSSTLKNISIFFYFVKKGRIKIRSSSYFTYRSGSNFSFL